VHGAAGVLALFRGNLDESAVHAQRWLDGARARDDPYEISNALILLAGALQPDPEHAVAAADEAIRVARENDIPSCVLYGLVVRTMLPIDAADAAALLDEATEVARRLGDRQSAASMESFRGIVASRAGDWQGSLHHFVRAASEQLDIDERMMIPGVFWGASFATSRLGQLHSAGLLLGYAETHCMAVIVDDEGRALVAETEAILQRGIDADEVDRLRARGAALGPRDLVAVMREAVDLLDST